MQAPDLELGRWISWYSHSKKLWRALACLGPHELVQRLDDAQAHVGTQKKAAHLGWRLCASEGWLPPALCSLSPLGFLLCLPFLWKMLVLGSPSVLFIFLSNYTFLLDMKWLKGLGQLSAPIIPLSPNPQLKHGCSRQGFLQAWEDSKLPLLGPGAPTITK